MFEIVASCAFGIESVLLREANMLGFQGCRAENGRVIWSGESLDIARANIWFRTADRVFTAISKFRCRDFDDLFDNVNAVPWANIIDPPVRIVINLRGDKTYIRSFPSGQSIVKKAVIEKLRLKYKFKQLDESHRSCRIDIDLRDDQAVALLDTSGAGLHKRGYRTESTEAPLRETLAAALVSLSRWHPDTALTDPMCGAGTIPIEAAMVGLNQAPGLKRKFAMEEFAWISPKVWKEARTEAEAARRPGNFKVFGYDNDHRAVTAALTNAQNAGVSSWTAFQKRPFDQFSSKAQRGIFICNPPYGERIGDSDEAAALYREMGQIFKKFPGWSAYFLSGHEKFEKNFGRKASKNRKLYNGKIKCYLYQYKPDPSFQVAKPAGKAEKPIEKAEKSAETEIE